MAVEVTFGLTGTADSADMTAPHVILRGCVKASFTRGALGHLGATITLRFHVWAWEDGDKHRHRGRCNVRQSRAHAKMTSWALRQDRRREQNRWQIMNTFKSVKKEEMSVNDADWPASQRSQQFPLWLRYWYSFVQFPVAICCTVKDNPSPRVSDPEDKASCLSIQTRKRLTNP